MVVRRRKKSSIAKGEHSDDLGAEYPELIEFHQLVHQLEERFGKGGPRVGEIADPAAERLRFRAARSLAFQGKDIASVRQKAEHGRVEVRVNFLGLYGPSSPLPPYFTERIIESDIVPDPVEDFLDLFNHRLIALLHFIWRKYRYHLRYEEGARDPISKRLLALAGLPIVDDGGSGDSLPREQILAYLPAFTVHSGSASNIGRIIERVFGVPCHVTQFVRRMVPVPAASRFALGGANCVLGQDAVLGCEVEDYAGKYRVCLGPAPFEVLKELQPDGQWHGALILFLALLERDALEWDLSFEFEPDGIPAAQLGRVRLGSSCWLAGPIAENPVTVASRWSCEAPPANGGVWQ